MQKSSVTFSAAEIAAGIFKQLAPSPGVGKVIIPCYLYRNWSDVSLGLFSDSAMYVCYGIPSMYNLSGIYPLPSDESSRQNKWFTMQNPQSNFDNSGNAVSIEGLGIQIGTDGSITGGGGSVQFDFYYIINDL